MSRVRGVLFCLFVFLPDLSFAQAKRQEPTPACSATCSDTCQKELAADGCNPAIGLTACRMRKDQCVAACTRKCPRE